MASDQPTIAIIGGTGDLGTGLARLWADAGFAIVLGSRDGTKAHAAAEALDAGRLRVRGTDNISAAKAGEIVVLAVPYASHDATLAELKPVLTGKILVDAVVPLVPPKVSVVQLPAEGSAAVIAARILGEGVRVVSAFHNVGARKLHAGQKADCDVLVFGDDKDARDTVLGLARHIATGAVDGGVLANSAAAEALTSVLIGINRRYKIDGAGLRFTGLPVPA